MRSYGIQFWRSVPFLRLVIPLVIGILVKRYTAISFPAAIILALISLAFLFLTRFLRSTKKFTWRWMSGGALNMLIACSGAALLYCHDISNDKAWIGHYKKQPTALIIRLLEPLTEKTKSFKAIAKIEAILDNGKWIKAKARILVYFKKDSIPALSYGSQLIIRTSLQRISDPGNPGGFDYRQYCASQNIYHQVYIQRKDYRVTGAGGNALTRSLFAARDYTLHILKKFIRGEKEAGVAEALLIGYRNDLDKDLVRSYSNTGVVHIIAISGLHLGMIYGLLIGLLKPFRRNRPMRWAKPVIILAVLWGFALLTGAAASILRSAVMFSFIVISESLGRRTQVYNTLAASAFCLLVYDPNFLWDVGFQLSYTAVLSIILFMRPIYRQWYSRNKWLRTIWQLNAITLSAQVLTLPLILFYFHQFPNLFLFTNFIAVPVSGFILYGELFLLLCSAIPRLNYAMGDLVTFLIRQLNGLIERTDRLPFAATTGIQIDLWQACILYIAIICIVVWLWKKDTRPLLTGLTTLVLFSSLAAFNSIQQEKQHKLVVYNIPRHRAMDLIEGKQHRFIGDQGLERDQVINNFHLQPSRVLHGTRTADTLRSTIIHKHLIITANTTILLLDGPIQLPAPARKIPVDIIIISGNPTLYLSQLAGVFDCTQYVFDSSNPLWKIRYWKKDADSLHLRHHSVPEQGAFERDL
jgi:competence protein ComEC